MADRHDDDPRVLRAIAHPLRGRILDELAAAGPLRAADVAAELGIPANQASFHLRQLAKYGLVEPAPEVARDKRDRVWRLVDTRGTDIHIQDVERMPGGKAAVAVFQRNKAAWAHRLVDEFFGLRRTKGSFSSLHETPVRLTREEGDEMMRELSEVLERWNDRTRGRDDDRRTYLFFSMIQPYPDLASSDGGAEAEVSS